jgi:hypothetical protein
MIRRHQRAGTHIRALSKIHGRVWLALTPDPRLMQKESSMQQLTQDRDRPRIGRALARVAATLLLAAALCQPEVAHAAHGGGGFGGGGGGHGGGFGGFHGGGFHGGGFHGGGFHAGGFAGFHAGRFHGGFAGLHSVYGHANGGHWDHGWHNGRYGWWWGADGLGWTYYPDYGFYDYNQPYAAQSWYYCSDPAGYYPYVTQCNAGWQTVPAS